LISIDPGGPTPARRGPREPQRGATTCSAPARPAQTPPGRSCR
jgi:hypothetical protein